MTIVDGMKVDQVITGGAHLGPGSGSDNCRFSHGLDPQVGKDCRTTHLRRLHVQEESGQSDPWQTRHFGATVR